MATVFLSQVFGFHLTKGHQIAIFLILMLTSKGTASVTGSGFSVFLQKWKYNH